MFCGRALSHLHADPQGTRSLTAHPLYHSHPAYHLTDLDLPPVMWRPISNPSETTPSHSQTPCSPQNRCILAAVSRTRSRVPQSPITGTAPTHRDILFLSILHTEGRVPSQSTRPNAPVPSLGRSPFQARPQAIPAKSGANFSKPTPSAASVRRRTFFWETIVMRSVRRRTLSQNSLYHTVMPTNPVYANLANLLNQIPQKPTPTRQFLPVTAQLVTSRPCKIQNLTVPCIIRDPILATHHPPCYTGHHRQPRQHCLDNTEGLTVV